MNSGIRWASGLSMISTLSTTVSLYCPLGRDMTTPNGAFERRSIILFRIPSRMEYAEICESTVEMPRETTETKKNSAAKKTQPRSELRRKCPLSIGRKNSIEAKEGGECARHVENREKTPIRAAFPCMDQHTMQAEKANSSLGSR